MPVVSTHGPAGVWLSLIRLRFHYLWHSMAAGDVVSVLEGAEQDKWVSEWILPTVRMVVCLEAILVDSCGGVFKSGVKGGMYICHHRQDNDILSSRKVCKNDLYFWYCGFPCQIACLVWLLFFFLYNTSAIMHWFRLLSPILIQLRSCVFQLRVVVTSAVPFYFAIYITW